MQTVWAGATQNSAGEDNQEVSSPAQEAPFSPEDLGTGIVGFSMGRGRGTEREIPNNILEGFSKHLGLNCECPSSPLPHSLFSVIPHSFWRVPWQWMKWS